MIGMAVKCDTCQKLYLLSESPWCACECYPEGIPETIYQNPLKSEMAIKCPEYEFDPDWDKD
ncbi:MAG: hypothetical protein IJN57_09045 [Oscillospiraceae bacterium]|nr:hypothetical protein [Oscillospiraceae bacterium]